LTTERQSRVIALSDSLRCLAFSLGQQVIGDLIKGRHDAIGMDVAQAGVVLAEPQ
jgi:hypothetical protein